MRKALQSDGISSAAQVLEQVSRARIEHPPKEIGFGRWELSIPWLSMPGVPGYFALLGKYPELKSPDKQTQVKAWHKFIRSSESRPYRIR